MSSQARVSTYTELRENEVLTISPKCDASHRRAGSGSS